MGKRGPNAFKRNDAIRAVESARAAGVTPTVVEVITKDGTTFRIYGDKAAPTPTPDGTREVMTSAEWNAEIAKLKEKKGK